MCVAGLLLEVKKMNYQDILDGIERFGSTKDNVCELFLGVNSQKIHENVILAPWWEPTIFPIFLQHIEQISAVCSVKVWNITRNNTTITYIKTGIGAPLLTDVVLALGVTSCEKIVFIGSVGALKETMSIGDIVIPEYAMNGNGVSRYLKGNPLTRQDSFGKKIHPDEGLYCVVHEYAQKVCGEQHVSYHVGRTFSIDTIFAQYMYVDEIKNMGCDSIEMETASVFQAAKLARKKAVSILSVSDNTVTKKSLLSGRTEDDMNYRKHTRQTIFPQLIMELFR